jgi:hypothetical protein
MWGCPDLFRGVVFATLQRKRKAYGTLCALVREELVDLARAGKEFPSASTDRCGMLCRRDIAHTGRGTSSDQLPLDLAKPLDGEGEIFTAVGG